MIQRFFFAVVTNQKFDIFIMIIILLNMILMGLEHYEQSEDFEHGLYVVNTTSSPKTSSMVSMSSTLRAVRRLRAWSVCRQHGVHHHFHQRVHPETHQSSTALLQTSVERLRLRRRRRLSSWSVFCCQSKLQWPSTSANHIIEPQLSYFWSHAMLT